MHETLDEFGRRAENLMMQGAGLVTWDTDPAYGCKGVGMGWADRRYDSATTWSEERVEP